MKMKGLVVVSTLILVAASHVGESRWMGDDVTVESTVTCEATYGFLPCSTSIWGLLFLIVVYNILLSMAGQYVGEGSNLFFQIIGPGVVGGSVFQFLGSIPRLVVLLGQFFNFLFFSFFSKIITPSLLKELTYACIIYIYIYLNF